MAQHEWVLMNGTRFWDGQYWVNEYPDAARYDVTNGNQLMASAQKLGATSIVWAYGLNIEKRIAVPWTAVTTSEDTTESEARIAAARRRAEFAISHCFDAMGHIDLALQSLSSVVGSNEVYRELRDMRGALREIPRRLEADAYGAKLKLDRSPKPEEEKRYNLKRKRASRKKK